LVVRNDRGEKDRRDLFYVRNVSRLLPEISRVPWLIIKNDTRAA